MEISYKEAIEKGILFLYHDDLDYEEGVIPIEDAPDYYKGETLQSLKVIGEDDEGLVLEKDQYKVKV